MKTCPFCAEQIESAPIVCKHCRRDLPAIAVARATAPPKRNRHTRLLGLLTVLLLLVGYRVATGAGKGGVVGIMSRARTIRIGSSDLTIGAGSVHHVEWDVTPEQPSCRLTGHIAATQGGNRDVQVYVLTADDYANLMNGHPSRAFFQTEKITAVTLDVRTSTPGPKVLAISNAFSILTAKQVQIRDLQVTCQ